MGPKLPDKSRKKPLGIRLQGFTLRSYRLEKEKGQLFRRRPMLPTD
jgi:hypothetical protein